MNCIVHPGGLELTKYAVDACDLAKAAKILDIGCGHGDTASFLRNDYGYSITGIDNNAEAVKTAKERYSDLEFTEGDGQWLEYDSLSFDCVLMECVLSLMPNPVEALHEAYCTLKKGGYLIVHDLYLPHPSAEDFEVLEQIKKSKKEHANKINAEESINRRTGECPSSCQNDGSECPDDCQSMVMEAGAPCPDEVLSPCTIDGALILDDIFEALNELKLEKILFEDRKTDLTNFTAATIFNGGSRNYYSDIRHGKTKISYFLLVAKKAEV